MDKKEKKEFEYMAVQEVKWAAVFGIVTAFLIFIASNSILNSGFDGLLLGLPSIVVGIVTGYLCLICMIWSIYDFKKVFD